VPPPEPDEPLGMVDPHGLEPLIVRLSASSARIGRIALAVLSVVLEDGEIVEALVQGTYQHQAGLAAVTDRRVVLVNDHEWRPDVRSIPLTPELAVQGWQDDRTASLIFVAADRSITISDIADRPLAQEMARRLREKVASLAAAR
jgi:hypothetical protein